MSYARSIRGLGADCGPCTIAAGDACEICPDGVSDDFPECAGCVNGMRQTVISAAEQSLIFPIVAGVVTTLAVAWLSTKLLGRGKKAA
jgi:bacterioferritin-associated ferredoxin